MQKIFIRFFVIVMAITVGLTLLANFTLQTIFSQNRAKTEAAAMLAEISRRIDVNNLAIQDLTVNLNENYIARAKGFAEIIAQNPSILYSYDEMVRMTEVLNVDEVHVTDENGILLWGNIKEYYGMDFATTDQTRPFLPALADKDFEMAQSPQPNGNEGKLFQYISVARQDKPGVVQVGVRPEILDNALANNRIDVVIANYNVSQGLNVVALDKKTGLVVGDSKNELIGRRYQEIGIEDAYFNLADASGWLTMDGEKQFAVFGEMGDYLVEVSFSEQYLFSERQNQNFVAAVSSILLGFTIVVAIFILLKHIVISDIETVNRDLKKITHGRLEVVVDVKSTPEFVALSGSINEMVASLKRQMDEIAQQAADLEARNRDITASLKYAKKIQHNLLPSSKAFDDTFADYCILWEPKDVVGGDIYWMKGFRQGAVLCVCDCTGHGTPGALLTMLVVTALDTIVSEETCSDTATILWELEQRLISTLNVTEGERDSADIKDGADLSILYIGRDGTITLSSAKLHIFVCNGKTVENIRGQKLTLGDGSLKNREQIQTLTISASKDNAYYIVSDGLFEQVGGEGHVPFGYSRFKQMILTEHGRPQTEIAEDIWTAFEAYMGSELRRDDVTLVSFKL